MPPAIRISKRPLLDEIDRSAEQGFELALEFDEVPESPGRRGMERHQYIDVAVRPEVRSHGGTEDGQLVDEPPAGKLNESVPGDVDGVRSRHPCILPAPSLREPTPTESSDLAVPPFDFRLPTLYPQSMDLRIVLVEPQDAGNIGAAARAMKNFGYSDLVIVEKMPARVDTISEWWATGAQDLVHGARRVATLEEALADCHMTVATTAVRGREVYDQMTPKALARFASESLSSDERLAVVFGRERSGLTAEEVSLCQRTATIETSPEFPTMNLAVSVAVFCYELAGGLRPMPEPKESAQDELLQLMHRRAFDLLRDVGFLYPDNPERVYRELRALAGRAHLTTREASLILAAISKLEYATRK